MLGGGEMVAARILTRPGSSGEKQGGDHRRADNAAMGCRADVRMAVVVTRDPGAVNNQAHHDDP